MSRARSRDGTLIAYWTSGEGPPLVLVHGAVSDHRRWAPLLPFLEPERTVHALDRRGRGDSGDTSPYAIDREVEDVVAVVEAVAGAHGDVDLLGHSLGAQLALRAAAATNRLQRLVLYEPPMNPPSLGGLVDRLDALLAAGRHEELVVTFLREAVGMPAPELAALRGQPTWPARVSAAPALPRELRAVSGLDPAVAAGVSVPTLMLVGGDSPQWVRTDADAVAAALPCCEVFVLEGQQHIADQLAPQLFAAHVIGFLTEHR